MSQSSPLIAEKKKSVEGFYTNIQFPESRGATQSNTTTDVYHARNLLSNRSNIDRIINNMSRVSSEIETLHAKQNTMREKVGNVELSQHESMVYDKYNNSLINGMNVPSYLIKQGQTGGIESCKAACDTNKNCGGFSHWSGNNSCWMKDVNILPNAPVANYSMSLKGDVWQGRFNAATGSFIETRTEPVNRGDVGVQSRGSLSADDIANIKDSFLDTSSYCNNEDIYIKADSQKISESSMQEGKCAKACADDDSCDMYLMSDVNTCNTYKNVSNVNGFCKAGDGHTFWGNIKKNISDKIVRFPETGGSEGFTSNENKEGFSLFGKPEPIVEGYNSFFGWINRAARNVEKVIEVNSRCKMMVVGNCSAWPNKTDANWFDDKDQGGSNTPSRASCAARQRVWEEGCRRNGNERTQVYQYYTPRGDKSGPVAPPPQYTWTTYVKRAKQEGFQNGNSSGLSTDYTKVGPYMDSENTGDRALPHYKGTDNSVNGASNCSKKCKDYKYFGMQDSGQCFCGNDWDKATKYGKGNCGENGGWWCNYIYKNHNNTATRKVDIERQRVRQDLEARIQEYGRGVEDLKKYNLDLDTMARGNSEIMDKAITDYRRNIAIVKEYRDDMTWTKDEGIIDTTNIVRKSHAYVYVLWFSLVVILLILLLRNAM